MYKQLQLTTLLLFGLINAAWSACDQPERHRPGHRGFGRRNHDEHHNHPHRKPLNPGDNGLNIGNNIQTVPLPLLPLPGYQIPVSIVHDDDVQAHVRTSEIKLCQASDASATPQRYDNETAQCYTPGSPDNPCGNLMDFYADLSNDVYGYCDCKPDDGCDYRPVAYWPSSKNCYHLHEQGPCGKNEWLISDETDQNSVNCVPRTCPPNPAEEADQSKKWFTKNGACYQLGTQAYCENPKESIYYDKGKSGPVLKCSATPVIRPCIKSLVVSSTINCSAGQKKNSAGRCSSVVEI